jgi:chromosome segregation ATPase
LHRRRFVQDGDVPVTVLRRDQGAEAPAHRAVAPSLPPQTSRLQRTEAALAAETAARERAERQLSETQSIVRDWQTKIGHAELAKNEAIEVLHKERETTAAIRAAEEERAARLQEAIEQAAAAESSAQSYHEQLIEERQARKNAEKALRAAEAARDAAEQLVETLTHEAQENRSAVARPEKVAAARAVRASPEAQRKWPVAEPAVTAKRRQQTEAAGEPEPVKWWLNTGPGTKRR